MIASLPQIAVKAVPEKVVSGSRPLSGGKPSEAFSTALAQATQNSQSPAADSRTPGGTRQAVNVATDKAKPESKSAPAPSTHSTAQRPAATNSHRPADSPTQDPSVTPAVLPQPIDLKASAVNVAVPGTMLISGNIGQTNPDSLLSLQEAAAPDSGNQLISLAVTGLAVAPTMNPVSGPSVVPAGASAPALMSDSNSSLAGSSVAAPATQAVASVPQGQRGDSQQAVAAAVQPAVKNDTKSMAPAATEALKSAVNKSDSLPDVKAAPDQQTRKIEVRPGPVPAPSPVVTAISDPKAVTTVSQVENARPGTETPRTNHIGSGNAVTPDLGTSPAVTSTSVLSAMPNLKLASPNTSLKVSMAAPSGTELSTRPVGNSAVQASASIPAKGSETNGAKSQTNAESNQAAASFSGSQGENGDSGSFAVKAPTAATTNVANVGQVTNAATNNKTDAATAMPGNSRVAGSLSASSADAVAQVEKHVETVAAYPNSLLQSAKLVERLGQSEFRVGIQAGEFGNVDIRTSMARNQFTAQISVERGELSKVLAAELPSLQNRLSDQRLPNANIILQNQSSGNSSGFDQGSRQSQNMPHTAAPHNAESNPVPAAIAAASEVDAPAGRLDIHM